MSYVSYTKKQLNEMIDNDINIKEIECYDRHDALKEYNRFKRYIHRNYLEYLFIVTIKSTTVTVEYTGEPGKRLL